MAIIKFGTTVVGLRGTIGGITFSANKSGPTARAWSRGSVPQTERQQAHKAIIANLPPEWAALTPAEKDAWDVWAADPLQARTNSLGESYQMSGFQAFMFINTVLTEVGLPTRTAPPSASQDSPPTLDSVEFHTTASAGTSQFTYTPPEFNLRSVVFAGAVVVGTGRQVRNANFFNIITANNLTSGTQPFQSQLEAIIGDIGLNRRLFWSIRRGRQGYLSAPATGFADVQEI